MSYPWSTSDARRLPSEMIDYVVDFLHKDKPSLLSCSVVSRSFATSSQLHLFRSLSCAWEENLGYTYIAPFFWEHPHLKSYVRGIRIIERTHPTLPSDDFNTICLCDITNILSTFPRLRLFGVGDVNLNFNDCCSLPRTQPFSPIDIVYLDLTDLTTHNASSQHILKLLRHFRNIRRLQIVDAWVLDEDEDDDEAVISEIDQEFAEFPSNWSPALAQLTISGHPDGGSSSMMAPYAHIFNTCNMLRNLEDLSIVCHDRRELASAIAITRGTNKGLVNLTINIAILFWDKVNVRNEEELLSITGKEASDFTRSQSAKSVVYFSQFKAVEGLWAVIIHLVALP